jgi:hypothetical protein
MGNLTVTVCRLVRGGNEHQHTAPAGEVIAAGNYVRFDGVTGRFIKGNATAANQLGDGFVALNAAAIGEPVTGVKRPCLLDLGTALAGIAFGGAVYVSDTDGTLSDTAGTASKVVGTVVPSWGTVTPGLLLRVDL